LLRGAAARAAASGGLRALDVSRCGAPGVTHEALLEVVTAHAATLQTLRCVFPPHECHGDGYVPGSTLQLDKLQALLRAAPQLQSADFVVSALLHTGAALQLLQRRGEFSRLRLHGLCIMDDGNNPVPADGVRAALDAVACYDAGPTLPFLGLECVLLSSALALEALERACAHVSVLNICECHLEAGAPASLARIVSGATLTGLHICHDGRRGPPLLDVAGATLLAAALHAKTSLTSFSLVNARLFDDPAVALALLAALTGHPGVRAIDINGNALRNLLAGNNDEHARAGTRAAIGAALGALVAANSPALTFLDVSYNGLGDVGLLPLFSALGANTHLRKLCCEWNTVRAAAAAALLASVHANTSLHELCVVAEDCQFEAAQQIGGYHPPTAALQAEALVAARATAPQAWFSSGRACVAAWLLRLLV
jgi:hypothetical protein